MSQPTHHGPIEFLMSLVDALEQSSTTATIIAGLKTRVSTALGLLTWIFTSTIQVISQTTTAAIVEIHNNIAAGLEIFVHNNSSGQTPLITFNRSGGTHAIPIAINSGDQLGLFRWQGYDSVTYAQGFGMRGRATENWNAGANGAQLEFVGILTGTLTQVDVMQLQPDAADQETMILIGVNRAGVKSLQRVTLGIADSGGVGFKLLRLPN